MSWPEQQLPWMTPWCKLLTLGNLSKIIKYVVFIPWLGVNAELSINQTRYIVKFTANIPKDYKVSFLARFMTSLESAQDGQKTNCNYFYLDAEHKISSIFFFCFAEKMHIFVLKMLLLKLWLLHRESIPVVCVLKQTDFQSHVRGTESSILWNKVLSIN